MWRLTEYISTTGYSCFWLSLPTFICTLTYIDFFLDKKDHTGYNNLACVLVVFLYTKNSAGCNKKRILLGNPG